MSIIAVGKEPSYSYGTNLSMVDKAAVQKGKETITQLHGTR